MRKLIPLLLVALLGLVASASAQETYSLPASAANVTTLTDIITFQNVDLCQRFSLAVGCTQAQVCTAAGPTLVPTGAACTAGEARAANVRIWALTQPGREEFVTFQIAVPRFADLLSGLAGLKATIQARAAAAATTTAKNNSCTQLGLPAGCYP